MRHLILSLALIFGLESAQACVTYNPSTGTYTVSPSGKKKNPKDRSDSCNSFYKLTHKKKSKTPCSKVESLVR
jgi:hypothetical protein